jgi:N6-adenosine-specific RNA methylase IME4
MMEYLAKGIYPPRPKLPKGWKFEQADQEFDDLIYDWRRLTIKALQKAFCFYLVLATPSEDKNPGPGRKRISPNGDNSPTWTEWVTAKGFGKNTLTRHFVKLQWLEREETTPELPEDKYRVIYADPPWCYGDELIDGYGAVVHHYKPMKTEKICALGEELKKIVNADAALFLWSTVPMIPDALQVIGAWGFVYKSHFVWDKISHNYGHYNSVRHELLLIATRGSCTPENKKLFDSVQTIERNGHSEKPQEFRDMIDILYPSGKGLEMFARIGPVGRWEVWGAEAELSDDTERKNVQG